MRHDQQSALVERLREADPYRRWSYAEHSMRNPAEHYIDPQWFADERQALFREMPQFVGLSVECAKSGAYITRDLGGIPIAVIRQRDGTLRAFVNACRHRAASLLVGDGKASSQRIVCPYHAWTYDMSGKLVSQPKSDDAFSDLDRDCDLTRRAVVEKHGLIYVHPTSAEPFEIDDQLHGYQDEFSQYGIDTAHHVETRVSTWNMNWKLMLDTFLEPYHVRFIHQKTIDPVFLSHQLYDSFGPLPRVIGLRRAIMDQLDSEKKEDWRLFPNAAAVYLLLPNALLTYQGDHLETWRLEPIDAQTTKAYTTIFAPEPPPTEKALRYWMRNLEVLCDVAFTEDFPMQMQIQKNLLAGAVDEVVYGRIEPGLVQFHTAVNGLVEDWRASRDARK
jgi:phenylpropionate dioxygenase-like ring-hydroxylating dioxygenase large terminal subunit